MSKIGSPDDKVAQIYEATKRIMMLERDLEYYRNKFLEATNKLKDHHYCEKCGVLIKLRK